MDMGLRSFLSDLLFICYPVKDDEPEVIMITPESHV